MKIWVITWRWSDGSGSGVLPYGFTDKNVAQLSLKVLHAEGSKVYELAGLELVDTLGILPRPLAESPDVVVYEARRVPHYGVEGKTPFEHEVLTVRTLNALKLEGITRLEQVVCWSERELLKIPNLGRKSLNELKEYLHSKGLELKK